MKRIHLFSVAVAVGLATGAGLAAQNEVTVTGCLQPAGERALSATPSTATTTTTTSPVGTSGSEPFILIKASPNPAGREAWTPDKPPVWYFIEGDAAKLRSNGNHLVEVKGTLGPADAENSTTEDKPKTEPPRGTIRVTELKVLNGSCVQ